MRNYLFSLQFIFIFIVFSCSCYSRHSKIENDSYLINENIEDTLNIYFNSKGVISFNPTDENIRKSIKILNEDNTLYANIDLLNQIIEVNNKKFKLEDFENNIELQAIYNFAPKEFYPDYYIIQFEIKNIYDSIAEIFIDKKNNIVKRINVNNDLFIIQTWKEHFIGSMVIFNKHTNSIRKYNNDNAVSMGYENSKDEYVFIISDIKGEWIKIECIDICGFACDSRYNGWIRWKKDNMLLIKFAYVC